MVEVIGNGLIGNHLRKMVFEDSSRYVFIASGVSNSKETRPSAFHREKQLVTNLMDCFGNHTLIYFSSNALNLSSNPLSLYYAHKIEMEGLISSHPSSVIFRLPQVVGPVVNQTLVSYIIKSLRISSPINIELYSRRRLLGITDIQRILRSCLAHDFPAQGNFVYSICPKYDISVEEIVLTIATELSLPLPALLYHKIGYSEPFLIETLPPSLKHSDPIMLSNYPSTLIKSHAHHIFNSFSK